MIIEPDILADVNFYTTEDNGRKVPISATQFAIIFQIGDDKFDCRLLLNNAGKIMPGDQKTNLPIKFLCNELVLPKLRVGSKFYLWDMRNIAEGMVTKIIKEI